MFFRPLCLQHECVTWRGRVWLELSCIYIYICICCWLLLSLTTFYFILSGSWTLRWRWKTLLVNPLNLFGLCCLVTWFLYWIWIYTFGCVFCNWQQKTRKILAEKIEQLNSAIDDVSAQLHADDAPNGVAMASDEIEASIWYSVCRVFSWTCHMCLAPRK